MAKTKLKVGLQWSHLKVVSSGQEYKVIAESPGVREERKCTYFDAVCTCGKILRIWSNEWEGTKHVKDCGCGCAGMDGNIVHINATITERQKVLLFQYAQQNKISLSMAFRLWLDAAQSIIGEVNSGAN